MPDNSAVLNICGWLYFVVTVVGFLLQRNGADYAVFVNTAQEFDGSDSGARPDEAVSWGKIKVNARPVKVYTTCTGEEQSWLCQ